MHTYSSALIYIYMHKENTWSTEIEVSYALLIQKKNFIQSQFLNPNQEFDSIKYLHEGENNHMMDTVLITTCNL